MKDPRRRALLRLAHQFRETDPDAFAASLSAEQVEEWHEFFLFEPAGGYSDWQQTALVTAAVVNSSGRHKKPVDPKVFVPKPPPTPLEAARMQRMRARMAKLQLAALVAAGGGGMIKADGTPGTVSDLFQET